MRAGAHFVDDSTDGRLRLPGERVGEHGRILAPAALALAGRKGQRGTEAERPRALRLPAGQGRQLRDQVGAERADSVYGIITAVSMGIIFVISPLLGAMTDRAARRMPPAPPP